MTQWQMLSSCNPHYHNYDNDRKDDDNVNNDHDDKGDDQMT